MTTYSSNIPAAIDYTSRDYYALRNELIQRVKARINTPDSGKVWTGEDPADFGVALIEAFAYMGDILNYYIDRAVNESFLPTATQRQNIINLANIYGYNVAGFRASSTTVTFSNYSTTSITIPMGTEVSAQVLCNDVVQQVVFTTQQDLLLDAGIDDGLGNISSYDGDVVATHGEDIGLRTENLAVSSDDVAGELVAVSSGLSNQIYVLLENQIVDNSIVVYVQNGDVYEMWSYVDHLSNSNPTDKVYTIDMDADNFVYLIFGDGVSGAIPTIHSAIKARYTVGGGSVGNINSGLIDTIVRIPNKTQTETDYITTYVTVTNIFTATGGADPESNDSIRINAPLVFGAMQRAVSLKDYESLAHVTQNIGKAHAIGSNANTINLYVAPKRDDVSQDQFPGYVGVDSSAGGQLIPNMALVDGTTTSLSGGGVNITLTGGAMLSTEWNALAADLADFLIDKTQVGTNVTILPPTYTKAEVGIAYTKYDQYTTEQVESNIKTAVLNNLGYNYIDFAQTITPEDVEFVIRQADGVRGAKVYNLQKQTNLTSIVQNISPIPVRYDIVAADDELVVFTADGISLTDLATYSYSQSSSGILDNISEANYAGNVTEMTLSPTFNGVGTYEYTHSADIVTILPVPLDPTMTITVDGLPAGQGPNFKTRYYAGDTVVILGTTLDGTVSVFILNVV
jgi:hypothetical protein